VAENEGSSAGINIGGSARVSRIDVQGDVVGRDKIVGATPEDAAAAQDRAQLLAVLAQLQEQVKALEAAPSGLREDASDELSKAKQAGEQGDKGRFLEKLETAHGYLERIADALPVGIQLAQTVAMIATRAAGLW
jgi:hypothetical protein